jgi:hypothetical protein
LNKPKRFGSPMKNHVPEIRLALFGQSGSGKTTFIASYLGNLHRHSFEEEYGYHLEATDTSNGNKLLERYHCMMEDGKFPPGTDQFFEHQFDFKVGGLPEPGLTVVWYDYPGGWWEQTPKDDAEKAARRDALAKLLTSHVGILLVDGMRYESEGLPYIRGLLDQFRHETRRIYDEFAAGGAPLELLPKQWIIAISKADLLPAETTAEKVCRDIRSGAGEQLAGVAKAVSSKSFGHQYLLLSSVQGDGGHVIDAKKFIGLQLIAPLALVSVLSELADKAGKGLEFDIFKTILKGISVLVDVIDNFSNFFPPRYQMIIQLLKAFAIKDMLDKSAEHLREKQKIAVAKGKVLEATAAALRAELASPAAKCAFFRNEPQRGH